MLFWSKENEKRERLASVPFFAGSKNKSHTFEQHFVGGVLFADVLARKLKDARNSRVSTGATNAGGADGKNPTPARVLEVRRRERSRATRVWRARKRRNRAQNESYRAPSRVERVWCWESFFCLLLSRDKDERDAKEIVVGCLNRSAVQVNNTIIAGSARLFIHAFLHEA